VSPPGILAYGVYVPHWRLVRSEVAAFLGGRAARGTRAVASYDEDTTSMGVEAARQVLRSTPTESSRPTALFFATSAPAYLEKSNAATIHAALGLDKSVGAYDMCGSVRSGAGALRAAFERRGTTLVVLSDMRWGRPGGADETGGGDGAIAFLIGESGPRIAELVAMSSATEEVLDRWRLPGELVSRSWEERFGESALVAPALRAYADGLAQAGLPEGDVARIAVTGSSSRAAKRVAAKLLTGGAAAVDDLSSSIGFAGAAHVGLSTIQALSGAASGTTVAVACVADGADVFLLRATDPQRVPQAPAQEQGAPLSYASFLSWRGELEREGPRRPDPLRPTAPAARRSESWKLGFVGSRCGECRQLHLPPQRTCLSCRSVDRMTPAPLADVPGTIATFSVDRLAFSLNPPALAVVVDLDGGGRFQCELTDADPESVRIGQRVEMTFRRLFTADGVHNYFWKAKPIPTANGACASNG
jgi:3-hydroxy-3-methylglutaryl CoA synthase/uncharacterized OB-fold protein